MIQRLFRCAYTPKLHPLKMQGQANIINDKTEKQPPFAGSYTKSENKCEETKGSSMSEQVVASLHPTYKLALFKRSIIIHLKIFIIYSICYLLVFW